MPSDLKPRNDTDDGGPLRGRVVAVPESRHLEVLAALLERRGARVVRCPLVAIRDAEDEDAVAAWLARTVDTPPALLVFYTGEGVERLAAFAERAGLEERFSATLAHAAILTRGPKPKRALRALGVPRTIEAPEPTTDGIVRALGPLPLEGKRIGVQLYGDSPPEALAEHFAARRIEPDYVVPYRYANQAEQDEVAKLIAGLAGGEIDAIAFTSTAQVDRLFAVAAERGLEPELDRGLGTVRVAAVGPVVARALEERGVRVDAVPHESFHMKPLVNALVTSFG